MLLGVAWRRLQTYDAAKVLHRGVNPDAARGHEDETFGQFTSATHGKSPLTGFVFFLLLPVVLQ